MRLVLILCLCAPEGGDAPPAGGSPPPPPKPRAPEAKRAYDPFSMESSAADGQVDLVHAEPGFEYTYAPTRDYVKTPLLLEDWRTRCRNKGFEPVNGPEYTGAPRREYHPTDPTAEIWRRPLTLRDAEFLKKMWDSVRDERYASHYFRHPSGLPDLLRDAMYVFHGFIAPPANMGVPTEDDLRELCLQLIQVRPGNRNNTRWV